MELYLENGDYVPDGAGGFVTVEHGEEMLQRVLTTLQIPEGSYLPMPELGSKLHLLSREKPSDRDVIALQYVVEALQSESQLQVDSVDVGEDEDGAMTLQIGLIWKGSLYTLSTTVI